MPQRSSIVLTDGTTPVTLTPKGGELGRTNYAATSLPTAAANPKLSFSYKDSANGVNRQQLSYREPITAVDNTTSETLIRGNVIVDINIAVPSVCTASQRVQAIKRAFDALTALEVELTTGEGQW